MIRKKIRSWFVELLQNKFRMIQGVGNVVAVDQLQNCAINAILGWFHFVAVS